MTPTHIVNETGFTLFTVRTSAAPPARTRSFVLKARFERDAEGAWVPAAKQPKPQPDMPFMDDLGRSLMWPTDFVPYKPRLDVIVHGSFHQPNGRAAPEGRGGFEFGAMRKELCFFGPRRARPDPGGTGWTIGRPEPVARVPLRWELGFGGLDHAANPLGRGFAPDPESGIFALPQIEYPGRLIARIGDRPPPANLAAVPSGFAERRRKWGTRDRRWAWFRAPLPPEDFDPSVHNAAPADQQLDRFATGDETLVLHHLHPTIPRLETRLPGLRPRLGVMRENGGETITIQEVAMHLDTVIVLPDEDALVLVWRGVVELTGEGERQPVLARAEIEAMEDEPEPFRTGLSVRMLNDYRARLPPEPPPPEPPPDISAQMAEARKLLAKAKLPDAVRQALDNEPDPARAFALLSDHVQNTIATMRQKYGIPPG